MECGRTLDQEDYLKFQARCREKSSSEMKEARQDMQSWRAAFVQFPVYSNAQGFITNRYRSPVTANCSPGMRPISVAFSPSR